MKRMPQDSTPATLSPTSTGPKVRILLVDDDASVRNSLSAVLLQEGYWVNTARDGRDALELIAITPPDLVLLDLNMPVKNGWDTFEQLTCKYPLLPVIIITARANQLFTVLGSGADALLEKPLEIPVFLHTIACVLAEPSQKHLARLAGKEPPFACSSTAKSAIDSTT